MSSKEIMNDDKKENNENDIKNNIENNSNEYSKKVGDYVLINEIGTGTFSKVAKGYHLITEEEVAVKILEKAQIKDDVDIERILREIEILKKVIHPHICQLYEAYSTIHNFYLMMEYVKGGDLFDFITNNDYLSESQSCKFFRQLISVIEYLNELDICHRDIKPENILLDEKHENIKLIDFGLSNYFNENKLLKSSCGSPCYASPEMLSGMPYLGITTDLWSAGIVLYSMLVGSLPFDDQELYELYKQIKSGKFYLPSTLSLEAMDLLKRILNVDPVKRIGLEGIKNHKWFQMDGYPLYKGVIAGKEKLEINLEVINYVMNNFFGKEKENGLDTISKNEFIDMVKDYYCNRYTATYFLTKKYILKINDNDVVFKKEENKQKDEINDDGEEKNMNLKYDKKICKKNIKDSIVENDDKKQNNNYIIKNDICIEIKREEKKKDNNFDRNKNENIPNIEDELKNIEFLAKTIDEINDNKALLINNNKTNSNRFGLDKIRIKNEENIIKRNRKNELYLNNIKNTNLKTDNSIEINQKKFDKNLLLKNASKTGNIIANNNISASNSNNNFGNNYIKTWGNNSINHISKNNKMDFNLTDKNKVSNINYDNYISFKYNLNNNINYIPKNKQENSFKNKKKSPKKNKDKNIKNNKNNNSCYNNKYNSIINNKNILGSSKDKENNFSFYLINNYINSNNMKNNKNIKINGYNFRKMINSARNDDSTDSNVNFSQYYFIKTQKYNMLKTIDIPGLYSPRYNTEANNNKKMENINCNSKPFNKIKVNLKIDNNNKLSVTNSPKYYKNNSINKKNSLEKNNNNSYINKNGKKKNVIMKVNEIKNKNINENKKIVNCFSFKKDHIIPNYSKNTNTNTNANANSKNNNKIQYQIYNLRESKPSSNNKRATNLYGNILNSNVKNICLKPKGIEIDNYAKKITGRNLSNSIISKNNTNSINNSKKNVINKNIDKINRNDIYNRKKIDNNSTKKNNLKNFIYKELFSIDEDKKITDVKCYFNERQLKNNILLLKESYSPNMCYSPKEYSFNGNGPCIYQSQLNILNNKNNLKERKIKQNFSNVYQKKKNLMIKTDYNSSLEKTYSPQSTGNKIKYIYKSKLSLY